MTARDVVMAAAGAAAGSSVLYSDDVFSTYLRSGTGASATVTTGINLSANGGLVITKARSAATGWYWTDTDRGVTKSLSSNGTAGQATDTNGITAFGTTGHTVGSDTNYNNSTGPVTYVDYVLRKAPKFFDVVAYTGDGVNGRQIVHALGVEPGMVVVKRTDIASSIGWAVGHRSSGNLCLNSTGAQNSAFNGDISGLTATTFTVSNYSDLNALGGSYVAYIFAHDPSADGLIQCGSFTTDGSGNATVNLGWEPQFVLYKNTGAAGGWVINDVARGASLTTIATLQANSGAAENASSTAAGLRPTAIGFDIGSGLVAASNNYAYLAIRRPNKPPTTGTQVFNAVARTGTGAAAAVTGVGFAPDFVTNDRRTVTSGFVFQDRLRGVTKDVYPYATNAESTNASTVTSFDMDGITVGTNAGWNGSTTSIINHFFRRAPRVFDQICYTGTGSNKTEAHNLGVAPELWLVKGRSGATQWVWGSNLLANTEKIVMPSPNGKVTDTTAWNSTYPTASTISLGTAAAVNTSAATYVAYLWATKAGISKVGSYTGNGTSQTINCGFTTGARFVMIIRTTASTAQDIYIWDTARGIVSGNDPHLSLNSTAAEVTTDDSIDPDTSGFIVNQVAATNINVNGASYICLAYA